MIRPNTLIVLGLALCASAPAPAQPAAWDGLSPNLSNVYRVSNAKTHTEMIRHANAHRVPFA